MNNILKKYKKVALSNKQILDLVNDKANIVLYPSLYKFSTIDQLLYPYNACFLLFETKPKFGHWCAIIKYGNTIEFFDSYSGYPDDVLNYIPDDFKKISNQNYPYLTKLLLDSPYNIEFNDHKYQKYNTNISTCGRHSALRILYKNLNLKQYDKLIKKLCKITNTDPDTLVTYLTLIINKGKF
mgnify:FL=1